MRMKENKDKKRNEPDPDRTDDLEVWNLTRYRCATGPLDTLFMLLNPYDDKPLLISG